MFTKCKILLTEGLSRTYNIRFVRLLLRNYNLLIPKWINTNNISLYASLILAFLFWLYYEIFCVSPVCPYYTGPDFPSLLNKFKSVGKTYRPTVYLFNSKLQWLFLKVYCRLELIYKLSKYRFSHESLFTQKILYKLLTFLTNTVLRSFFFRKIFKSQPPISLREVIEGHNSSLVVMDWYLPKWIAPECNTCNLFQPEQMSYDPNNGLSKDNEQLEMHKPDDSSVPIKPDMNDYFKMYTIDSLDGPEKDKELGSDNEDSSASYSSEYSFSSGDVEEDTKNDSLDPTPDFYSPKFNVSNRISEQFPESFPFIKSNDKFETFTKWPASPNPKIIRGVMVIIGDMNVSYRICSTRSGCYCNSKAYTYKENVCEVCNENDKKDYDGYNLEHPGFPTLRSMINDSLRSGFVCVHLHLNVNLGMASEAFPESTTLRSFPISLYTDVLLDFDCALNKVQERFPNHSIVAVGISYGANILLEYLSVSSKGGTIKVLSDSEPEVFNDFTQHVEKQHESTNTETQELHPTTDQPTDTNKTPVDLRSVDNLSDYTQGSRQSETMERRSQGSEVSYRLKSSFKIDRKNSTINTNLDTLRTLDSSIKQSNNTKSVPEPLYDDHFALNLNKEEFNTETKIVFPEHNSEIVLSPEKISAAVCINLNLKLSNNVLYNISKRKGKKSPYKRFCTSSFKDQLFGLLNTVHCKRTNTSLTKDCINYNCCHYNKIISRFGLFKKIFYRIFFIKNKIKPKVYNYSTEQLITHLHKEYRQSYRDLKKENRDFINYGTFLFDRLGVRACPDFKVSILMTMKHRFEREGPDGKVKVRHITEPPVYKCINKNVNTNLRVGKSVFSRRNNKMTSNVHKILDYKITKYINNLINSDYTRNCTNIKENMEFVKVPTLLLYSLDNSMINLRDIDIFEVIKNPNIVYYISQTGGYSTFLSGTGVSIIISSGMHPSTWFIGPALEFLEEMSTKSKTF